MAIKETLAGIIGIGMLAPALAHGCMYEFKNVLAGHLENTRQVQQDENSENSVREVILQDSTGRRYLMRIEPVNAYAKSVYKYMGDSLGTGVIFYCDGYEEITKGKRQGVTIGELI